MQTIYRRTRHIPGIWILMEGLPWETIRHPVVERVLESVPKRLVLARVYKLMQVSKQDDSANRRKPNWLIVG